MRILNNDADIACREVTLFLTENEARELQNCLAALLDDSQVHHLHVLDEDLTRMLNVSLYREGKLKGFHERARRLILDGH